MVKAIIFDLDGTLVLRKDIDWARRQYIDWLIYNGVRNPEKVLNHKLWLRRDTRIKLLNITIDEYKKWYENFQIAELKRNYMEWEKGNIFLAPKTYEVLSSIKSKKALVSNAPKEWVKFACDKFSLTDYFDFIFKREYVFGAPVKPDRRVKKIIENHIGKLSTESIIVGDGRNDMQFAANSNIKFISVFNRIADEEHYDSLGDLKKISSL